MGLHQIILAMLQENYLNLNFLSLLLLKGRRETRLMRVRNPLGNHSYNSFAGEMLWQLVKYKGGYMISK